MIEVGKDEGKTSSNIESSNWWSQKYYKPDAWLRSNTNFLDPEVSDIGSLIRALTEDEKDRRALIGFVNDPKTRTGAYCTISIIGNALRQGDVKPLIEEVYSSRNPRINLNGHFSSATGINLLLNHNATKEGAYLVLGIVDKIADKKRENQETLY